jgi:WS/DGAT/MGAT family acyltransferase
VGILEGSGLHAPDSSFPIDELRESVERKLYPLPRFRQQLCMPRRGLGWPVWVDAASFDVADHVEVIPVDSPGDHESFLAAAEALFDRPLDRRHPLWRLSFLPGLAEGRVGMVIKAHHAVADGVAGVASFGALFDTSPEGMPPAPPLWTPSPWPSARDLLADNLRRRAAEVGRMSGTLRHPVAAAHAARRFLPGLRETFTEDRAPRTTLNQPIGTHRTLAFISTDLDLVRAVGHARGGTVNDVLLTVVAAGLRTLLDRRGEAVDRLTLRAFVPVSLHREGPGRAVGNRDGAMVVPLPLGETDDLARLRSIVAQTVVRKRRPRAAGATLFRNGLAQRAFLRLAARQRLMNAYVANVPGPPMPLYLAGARVRELFPLVPLIGNVTLGVGALSYAGRLSITAVADREACPDLDDFVDGVQRSLRALAEPLVRRSSAVVLDDLVARAIAHAPRAGHPMPGASSTGSAGTSRTGPVAHQRRRRAS